MSAVNSTVSYRVISCVIGMKFMLGRRERRDQTWRILYIGVMPRGPYRCSWLG